MIRRARFIGCGSYLPSQILTNDDLAERLETSDDWIQQRTGIKSRHIAADGELTSDLAIAAARDALDNAGIPATSLDGIILASSTPDQTFPATAAKVQASLGIGGGFAFDVQAVCSGFMYGLSVADNFIRAGQAKRLLLIGAETYSRILDWDDRTTAVLFGDGAGAAILEAVEVPESESTTGPGVLSTHLHSDGDHWQQLYVDGGPSTTQTAGHVRMNGREVFRHAVKNLADVVDEALEANGLQASDIDWLVPHQANARIIEGTRRKLGMAEDRVVLTVDRHANTASASVPLALCEAVQDGRIKTGDLLLLEAMGGGFTWAGALVRW